MNINKNGNIMCTARLIIQEDMHIDDLIQQLKTIKEIIPNAIYISQNVLIISDKNKRSN